VQHHGGVSQGGKVECKGVVATDGGEGSLDGECMQAGRQHGKLVVNVNWCGSQDCNGKAFWKLLKHLQLKQSGGQNTLIPNCYIQPCATNDSLKKGSS
jgi:hypothetical protein